MDWNDLAVRLVGALTIPIVVLLVGVSKNLFSKLPRVTLPILAVAFGVTADWVAAQLGVGKFTPLSGALLGAAAVWLRELVNTARQHGTGA